MMINLEIRIARLEQELSDLEALCEEKSDAYAKLQMQYNKLCNDHKEMQSKYSSVLNQLIDLQEKTKKAMGE